MSTICPPSTSFSNLSCLPCRPSTPFSLSPCNCVLVGKQSVFSLRKSFLSLHFWQISFSSVPIPLWVFYFGTFISSLFLNRRKFLIYLKCHCSRQNLLILCPCNGWFALHGTILVPLREPAPITVTRHIPSQLSHLSQFVCYSSTLLYHIVRVQSPSGLTWHVASCWYYIIVCVPYFSIHPILVSTSYSNLSIYLIYQSTPNSSFFSSTLFSHLPYLSSTLFSNLTFLIYLIYKSTLNHHLPQNLIYPILSPTKYLFLLARLLSVWGQLIIYAWVRD